MMMMLMMHQSCIGIYMCGMQNMISVLFTKLFNAADISFSKQYVKINSTSYCPALYLIDVARSRYCANFAVLKFTWL